MSLSGKGDWCEGNSSDKARPSIEFVLFAVGYVNSMSCKMSVGSSIVDESIVACVGSIPIAICLDGMVAVATSGVDTIAGIDLV